MILFIVHMNLLSIIMASLVWTKHLNRYFIRSISLWPSIWSHIFYSNSQYFLCVCLRVLCISHFVLRDRCTTGFWMVHLKTTAIETRLNQWEAAKSAACTDKQLNVSSCHAAICITTKKVFTFLFYCQLELFSFLAEAALDRPKLGTGPKKTIWTGLVHKGRSQTGFSPAIGHLAEMLNVWLRL